MTPRRAKFIVVCLVWSIMTATVLPLGANPAEAQLAGRAVQPTEFFQQIRAEAAQKCDPQSGRGIGSPLNRETNPFARDLHQSLSQSLNDAMTELFEQKLPRLLESNIDRIVRQELNNRMGDFGNLISRRTNSLRSQGYSDRAEGEPGYDERYDIRNRLPEIIAESYQEFLTNFSREDLRQILEREVEERAPELIGEYFQAEYERDELGNLIYRNEANEVVTDGEGEPTVIRESELRRIIVSEFGPEIDTLVRQYSAQQVIQIISDVQSLLSNFGQQLRTIRDPLSFLSSLIQQLDEAARLGEQITALQSAMGGEMQRELIDAMTHYALEAVINSDSLATYSRQGARHWLDNGLETMDVDTESEATAFSQSPGAETWINNFNFDADPTPLTSGAPETMFNALLGPGANPFIERNRVARGGLTDAQLSNIFATGFSGQLTSANRGVVGNLSPRGYQNLISQGFGFDTVLDSSIIALANTGSDIASAAVTSVTDAITAPLLGDFRPPTSVDGLTSDIGSNINANTSNIANAATNGLRNLGNTFKGTLTDSLAGGLSQMVAGVPYAGPLLASLTDQLVTDLVRPVLDFLIPTTQSTLTTGVGLSTASGGVTRAYSPDVGGINRVHDVGTEGIATAVLGATEAIGAATAAIELNVGISNTHLATIQSQTKTSNENEGVIIQTEEEIKALNLQQCMYDYFVERTQGYLAANDLFYDREARQKNALAIRNTTDNVRRNVLGAGDLVTSGVSGVVETNPTTGGQENRQPLVRNLNDKLAEADLEATGVFLNQIDESGLLPEFKEEIVQQTVRLVSAGNSDTVSTIDQSDYEKISSLGRETEIPDEDYWGVWLDFIQPPNNKALSSAQASRKLAEARGANKQGVARAHLANTGFSDIRVCDALVTSPGLPGQFCASWRVLTSGATVKAIWDKLLAAPLDQAIVGDKVGTDFVADFLPEMVRWLVNPTADPENEPAPLPTNNPCPGPGPCPSTGWQTNSPNIDSANQSFENLILINL